MASDRQVLAAIGMKTGGDCPLFRACSTDLWRPETEVLRLRGKTFFIFHAAKISTARCTMMQICTTA